MPFQQFSQSMPNFQYDPVEYWASRILAWGLVVAILVVLYAAVKVYRGQMQGFAAKGLLFAGIVLLPIFTVSTGMLLVFVRAERVEFCGSCHHALESFVDDMRNPQSEGLAAVHFKNRYIASNQCYECHTSYGLFGTFQAKLAGIAQVSRYYTRTYEVPLKMLKPYSNEDCLKCHAASMKWLSHQVHTPAGMGEALFDDDVSCMDCHGTAHHVAEGEEAS
jgi:nitrate/TMAO reductase-like tetraheme cytochrome c subunit